MYKVIDVNNSLNLVTGEYEPETRTRIAPGFDGDLVDKGHCTQWMYGTDKLGMIRVSQGAGMATSPRSGFVYHKGVVEIEYLLSSKCDLSYPDGKHFDFMPGDCLRHLPDQPHLMVTAIPEHMKILVILNIAPGDCTRTWFEGDQYYHEDGHYEVKTCTDVEPLHPAEYPNADVRIVYEVPQQERPICFAEVTIHPGNQSVDLAGSIPVSGFISNANADAMFLVRSGTGTAIYPDKAYPLYTDMSMYNYAGQPYKIMNTGTEDLVLLCTYSVGTFKELERVPVKVTW